MQEGVTLQYINKKEHVFLKMFYNMLTIICFGECENLERENVKEYEYANQYSPVIVNLSDNWAFNVYQ